MGCHVASYKYPHLLRARAQTPLPSPACEGGTQLYLNLRLCLSRTTEASAAGFPEPATWCNRAACCAQRTRCPPRAVEIVHRAAALLFLPSGGHLAIDRCLRPALELPRRHGVGQVRNAFSWARLDVQGSGDSPGMSDWHCSFVHARSWPFARNVADLFAWLSIG